MQPSHETGLVKTLLDARIYGERLDIRCHELGEEGDVLGVELYLGVPSRFHKDIKPSEWQNHNDCRDRDPVLSSNRVAGIKSPIHPLCTPAKNYYGWPP